MVALGVSTMYGFSIFTEHLKTKYGFDQSDITTISTVCNVLGYCSFIFGVVLDFAGPKVQLMLSGSFALLGLVLFGLTLDGKIHSDNKQTMLIMMSVFNGIMYLGCPSLDGGAILPLMMHFPLNRGYMIIIQKTFAGLGTSILMAYFNAFFKSPKGDDYSKFSAYSYFIGVQAFVCASVGALFIDFPAYSPCDLRKRRLTEQQLEDGKATLKVYLRQPAPFRRIIIGCTIVVCLLIHLTVSSIIGSFTTISQSGYRVIWAIVIIFLFSFCLMATPLQFLGPYRPPDRQTEFFCVGEVDDGDDELREPVEDEPAVISASGDPQYQGSFWSHLLTLDLWLFWLCLFSMWGTSTVLQFNSAQIYRSSNWGVYDAANQSFNVALIGVGSALGRITGGILDTWVARRRANGLKNIYTTMFFPLSSILLALGFLLIIVLPAKAIVLPFLIASMGNGMGWGLGVVCVRIIYAEDMGKHYNFMFSSGILATVGLNRFMFGEMFDAKAREFGTLPFCNKPVCVNNQMWILLACNVVSTASAIALHWRFARFANAQIAAGAATADVVDEESEGEMDVTDDMIEEMLDQKVDPLAEEESRADQPRSQGKSQNASPRER